MANGRLAPGDGADGPPAALARAAAEAGTSTDALAIGAALAQPWATVVLSGVVTPAQLAGNLAALAVPGEVVARVTELGLAEPPPDYWATRSARAWA
jgi:aryl-alcohol dehydrogenase-like predicted oxidoreductase